MDILKDGRNYISVGNEAFNGNNNSVINDIYSITNNLTYYAGMHTLTGGLSYEYQTVGNMFMRGSNGYYLFASVDDFVNNAAPLKYAQTYSMVKGEDAIYAAEMKIGQFAAYVQDDINLSSRFRLTAGVRVDLPVYPEQPLANPAITALDFLDREGNQINLTTGQFPKSSPLFSPRVGFRYDLEEDKSLVLRGGTGIFTGRIPFVWLTNIPQNSGMPQYSSAVTYASAGIDMNNYKFNPDTKAYNPFYNTSVPAQYFPTTAGTVASTDFAVTEKNFKFPQVWRSNIGVDKTFEGGWKLTGEVLYSKDVNAVAMYNANQRIPTSTVTTGSVTRPAFSANNNTARRVVPSVTNAVVLDNTGEGYSLVLTGQVSKAFSNGLFGSLAYTFTDTKDVTANPGSQAASVWNSNPTSDNLNSLEMAPSSYAVPHRVMGNISYRKEYIKHLGTTVSLYYEGAHQGRYSYVYNGDLNWDGYSQDLMYIPTNATNASEIRFVDKTIDGKAYTAAEQAQIFEEFIKQDPYLNKNRGKVAERYGALAAWYNRFDVKFMQDIFLNVGGKRHTLQFSADVLNFSNLLNNKWGVRKRYVINNPLRVESVTSGVPSFSLSGTGSGPATETYVDNISTSSTWSLQFGLRYIFN
ncbi:MAG: TonB-dependent receptor [Leadbetterella sp.]|nr:TonB-dependent receptor [Leadbetterella sp.]